jgi:hypothetical protein
LGLTLFVQGLKTVLFPIGEAMAWDFAAKGSVWWLLRFTFAFGVLPKEITGIDYDSGAVTTSIIAVALVTVLGVRLASSTEGRNPLTDGFELNASTSLIPIGLLVGYARISEWQAGRLAWKRDQSSGGYWGPPHFKLILVFADDNVTQEVVAAARNAGATGSTMVNQARGEGAVPFLV